MSFLLLKVKSSSYPTFLLSLVTLYGAYNQDMKQSDEDYVAQDQGSATDNKNHHKSKKGVAIRLNKKEMIETSLKSFLPEGVTLSQLQPLTPDQYNRLVETKDAPEFSLNYKTFLAKVCKVTDGDTVKAILYLNGAATRFIFRVSGLDTPQCRKGQAKEFGKKVKEVLSSMIDGKICKLQAGDFDKYGRILARIYTFSEGKELCINDFLIQHEMAKVYYGKTKVEFTSSDQEEFLKTFKSKVWPKTVHYPLEKM